MHWDHPRVCGEKPNRLVWEHWKQGSPPRMRGKGVDLAQRVNPHGITPAYAGKRGRWGCQSPQSWDHPRVCGEKLVTMVLTGVFAGSPPRMRGKDHPCGRNSALPGITPAYAGKSCFGVGFPPIRGDHPRVCGEKAILDPSLSAEAGSPPRMRGKDSESLEIQVLLFSSAHFSFNF